MQRGLALAVQGVNGNRRLVIPLVRQLLDRHALFAITQRMAKLGLVQIRHVISLVTRALQAEIVRGQPDVALSHRSEQTVDLVPTVRQATAVAVFCGKDSI